MLECFKVRVPKKTGLLKSKARGIYHLIKLQNSLSVEKKKVCARPVLRLFKMVLMLPLYIVKLNDIFPI